MALEFEVLQVWQCGVSLNHEQAGSAQDQLLDPSEFCLKLLVKDLFYGANYMLQQHSQNAKDIQLTLEQHRFELQGTTYSQLFFNSKY